MPGSNEYKSQLPPPVFPPVDIEEYLDSLDPNWEELDTPLPVMDGLEDMFPTSGEGYDVVEPYLTTIEGLIEDIQEDTEKFNESIEKLNEQIVQLTTESKFVPSYKFQKKAREIDTVRINYMMEVDDGDEDDLAYLEEIKPLLQEIINIYNDELTCDQKLQERWSIAMDSFDKLRNDVDYDTDEFRGSLRNKVQDVRDKLAEYKTQYDSYDNSESLDDLNKLKYEGYNQNLEEFERLLDLYEQYEGESLDQNFYEKELGYHESLTRGALNQLKGQNKPDADMTGADYDVKKKKRNEVSARRAGLILTVTDGCEINHALNKISLYREKYSDAAAKGKIPSNNLNADQYNMAKKDYDEINDGIKARLWLTESRFDIERVDNRTTLNSDKVPLSPSDRYVYDYEAAADMGLTNLWDTNDGVAFNDVVQGSLGDCFFLAALAAVAKVDPQIIKNNIEDNQDGTYNITLYLLGVEVGETSWGEKVITRSDNPSERNEVVITITDKFVSDSDKKSPYASSEAGENEKWVLLYEKALANALGGYGNIEEGGFSDEAMSIITNKTTDSYIVLPTEYSNGNPMPDFINKNNNAVDNLITQMAAGKMATVDSYESSVVNVKTVSPTVTNPGATTNLPTVGHSYAVLGYDPSTQLFELYDPHGWTFTVSKADFTNVFYRISISN